MHFVCIKFWKYLRVEAKLFYKLVNDGWMMGTMSKNGCPHISVQGWMCVWTFDPCYNKSRWCLPWPHYYFYATFSVPTWNVKTSIWYEEAAVNGLCRPLWRNHDWSMGSFTSLRSRFPGVLEDKWVCDNKASKREVCYQLGTGPSEFVLAERKMDGGGKCSECMSSPRWWGTVAEWRLLRSHADSSIPHPDDRI